ncbi:MAG: hypothetical protein BWY11_02505 [Firmicutes bacterium ADurb.Bin182]|nr:MAG: hypothetical protein BWY11_02505 [Firmicutes bacterium ADurb.Bin182]
MFKSTKELTEAYERLYLDEVLPAVEKGLSASVYTQVSDMEDEVNGVFTFDRAKMKLEPETVRNLNDLLKSAGNAKCGSD